MLSLHQLRCFLAAYELGSLTAAAEELGYAQPSVSEQIRGPGEDARHARCSAGSAEASCRPRSPSRCARTPRPTMAAAEEARRAVQSVMALETGTIRFGMFGTARLYAGAGLVADVLARHPGVRVELIGQNSNDVQEDLRRGRLEAAMIAVPTVEQRGHARHAGRPRRAGLHQRRPRAARVPGHRAAAGGGLAGDAGDDLAGRRLHPHRAAPDAARDRPQPAAPGSRSRTSRPPSSWSGWAWRTPSSRGAPPSSCCPGWRRSRLGLAAPAPVRHARHRPPRRRHALPRRAADDRARHRADPGHRHSGETALTPHRPLCV